VYNNVLSTFDEIKMYTGLTVAVKVFDHGNRIKAVLAIYGCPSLSYSHLPADTRSSKVDDFGTNRKRVMRLRTVR